MHNDHFKHWDLGLQYPPMGVNWLENWSVWLTHLVKLLVFLVWSLMKEFQNPRAGKLNLYLHPFLNANLFKVFPYSCIVFML